MSTQDRPACTPSFRVTGLLLMAQASVLAVGGEGTGGGPPHLGVCGLSMPAPVGTCGREGRGRGPECGLCSQAQPRERSHPPPSAPLS